MPDTPANLRRHPGVRGRARVALLGYPVAHSRSPAMHNAAFAALGLDWRYEAIAVEPERFAKVTRGLEQRGFAGANVTIPHKLAALEVADSASDVASATGAANTLVFRDGQIAADNTDVTGFLEALWEHAPEAPKDMRALVLGAGGAARAVVYALLRSGAAAVAVWNRHPERAEALVERLASHSGDTSLRVTPEPQLTQADLLVNATSVGIGSRMAFEAGMDDRLRGDFKELHFSADELDDRHVVVDLVYRRGGTELVRAARARGLRCADGIDVLVHQGAASFQLWTGKRPPLEAMRSGAGDEKEE